MPSHRPNRPEHALPGTPPRPQRQTGQPRRPLHRRCDRFRAAARRHHPLTTGTADAATEEQWDNVAQCESGGNWHINTGNGYYGGLQFTAGHLARLRRRSTTPPAPTSPARPSRSRSPRRCSPAQGWGAWPVCSQRRGPAQVESWPRGGRRDQPQPRTATPLHQPQGRQGASTSSARATRCRRSPRGTTCAGGWRALYRANRTLIGSNPDLIRIGMHLHLPA